MAFIWSSVSLNSKASSNSRCHSVSGAKAMALGASAHRIELEQFVGHVFHGLLHARLGLLPLRRAQPVQNRLHAFRRAILLHQVEPRERHIQPRAFGVLQDHELGSCAVFLRNFLQPLVLSDAVFDVHDVVADREIAKVREKCRHLRLLPLRTSQRNFRLVEQIARAKQDQVRVGHDDAFGYVGLDDGRGRDIVGEVGGLVDEDFHAGLGRAAADAERQVVLVEDVGQALDFAGARNCEDHALAFARELADFFRHGGDRTVKAHGRLRREEMCSSSVLNAKLLEIGAKQFQRSLRCSGER